MLFQGDEYENSPYYTDDVVDVASSRRYFNFPKLFGVGFLGIAIVLGTSFASNIRIGSTGSVEYGQGLLKTTACSGSTSLSLNPASSFSNSSGAGAYKVASITVSNIPVGCSGNDFIIRAYTDTGSTPLAIFNTTSTDAVVYDNSGSYSAAGNTANGPTGLTVTTNSSSSFTATFDVPVAASATTIEYTLESLAHSGLYLGGTGPGGGVIFYVNLAGFTEYGTSCNTSCHYLEAAPKTWSGGAADPYPVPFATATYQSTSISSFNGYSANNQGFGYGYVNSEAIRNQQGTYNASTNSYAAGAARAYTGNSLTDWFLPSLSELEELCKYAHSQTTGNLGVACANGTYITTGTYGFSPQMNPGNYGVPYWSSTEVSATNAYWTYFKGNVGYHNSGTKAGDAASTLRPVRAF